MNYMIAINTFDSGRFRGVDVEYAEDNYRLPSDQVVNHTEGYALLLPDDIREALLDIARRLDALKK